MSDAPPSPRSRPPVVTLTGPESTGKTTLAASLAHRYRAERSTEAARAYADARRAALGPEVAATDLLSRDDVDAIARAQLSGEDAAAARAERAGATLVIRDTDLVSTVVYARHYYGACAAWIEDEARRRRADVYLLCDVDLPWVADGQRDRPTERAALRDAFARALDAFGCRWSPVSGIGTARESAAIAAVDALVRASTAMPVG